MLSKNHSLTPSYDIYLIDLYFIFIISEHVENEDTLAENIEHVANSNLEQEPPIGRSLYAVY